MSLRWRMGHVAIRVRQSISGSMKIAVSPISEPKSGDTSIGFLISSQNMLLFLLPHPRAVGAEHSQLRPLIPTDEQGDYHEHGKADEELGDGIPGQIGDAEGPDAGDVREVGGGVPVFGDLAVSVAGFEEFEHLLARGVEDVIAAEAWDPDRVSLFSLRIGCQKIRQYTKVQQLAVV
ncbi:hypothetical protein PpBr36_04887 [Pyricularia pennisetigena]|uniref:hypothetical protein n=1 Tax=Pyricularia pennisetigena TaxID=1578925 RepID=UPI001154756F|nr:hypothetical protein PpBr36_04887 [Pyricularia pennisetigena]TLS27062.1 hypothetical protein PpBr36_04887 [Pyricularia pennisetigena]